MRLRCQCVLILSPGPNGDAPHQCSLFEVDFDHFKSQSVKYWCTQTRAGFSIYRKRGKIPRQRSHRSGVLGTAGPSGDFVGLLCAKATCGPVSTGELGGSSQRSQRWPVSLSHRSGCTDTNNPNRRRINTELSIKAKDHAVVAVPSLNTNEQVRRRGSRDSVYFPLA